MYTTKKATGIICTIMLPLPNNDKIDSSIIRHINDITPCEEKSVTELLDYSQPKPTGLIVTGFYLNTPEKIRQTPNQLNALIDRYGGHRILLIRIKSKITDLVITTEHLDQNQDEHDLIQKFKDKIKLIETADDVLNYMTTDAWEIPQIRKTMYTTIVYDKNNIYPSKNESKTISVRYKLDNKFTTYLQDMIIEPTKQRLTEWDELYLRIIRNSGKEQYTHYTDRLLDQHITLGPKPVENKMINPDKLTTIPDEIRKLYDQNNCVQYGETWIKEIEDHITQSIRMDDGIPVQHMTKNTTLDGLFPCNLGFIDERERPHKLEYPPNVLTPKVSLECSYHEENKQFLETFTKLCGEEPHQKLRLANTIRKCIHPGSSRGNYILISYNDETQKEKDLLLHVLKSLAHYTTITLPPKELRPNDNMLKQAIGYPVNATLVIIQADDNDTTNLWQYDGDSDCNHVFLRCSKTGFHASLNQTNTRHIELQHVPNLIHTIQETSKLEDILLWCYNCYKNNIN